MRPAFQRLLTAGAGIAAALVFLEAGLFVFGLLQNTAPRRSGTGHLAAGKRVVLCEGDSVTFGLGASIGESYPDQLENLLNAGGDRYRVVNKGKIGQNTSQLRENLRNHIHDLKPAIIVLLAGRANVWNLDKYQAYRKSNSPVPYVLKLVSGTRTYKLGRLLVEDIRNKRNRGRAPAEFGPETVPFNEMRWYVSDKAEYAHRLRRLNAALKTDPSDYQRLLAAGWLYEALGNSNEALRHFARAVALDPRGGEGYCGQGTVLAGMGSRTEAVAAFRQGLKVDPHFGKTYVQLALTLNAAGQPAAAVRCLEEGVRILPRYSWNYAILGNIHSQEGRIAAAIECYRKGIEADPEDRLNQNYLAMGSLYDGSGGREDVFRRIAECLQGLKSRGIDNPVFRDACAFFLGGNKPDRRIEGWVKDDLAAIVRICREENVQLILQNYPDGAYPRIEELLARAAADNELPLVDNTLEFARLTKNRPAGEYLTDDGHCLAAGNAVLAANVCRVIKSLDSRRESGEGKREQKN